MEGGVVKDVSGKLANGLNEPLHCLTSKGFRRHTCHLNVTIGKEFDIHLHPLIPCPIHLSAQYNRGLVKEGLGGDLSIGKDIFVA